MPAKQFGDGQDQIGCRDAFGQLAHQFDANDLRN